jgi:hypothetical protein
MASFSLRLAAHALIEPVVFSSADDLIPMSEAIRAAGDAAYAADKPSMGERYHARADYLLTLVR